MHNIMNMWDHWLTLKDVCEYTQLSQSTLHRSIKKNRLKVSKATGKLLFKKEWIDDFLENK